MKHPIVGGALAMAAALRITSAAAMDLQEVIAPPGAIACVSESSLWHYSDARDKHDGAAQRNLLGGECRNFAGKPYALLSDRNGTLKILILRKPDDWETAETFYTFEEMLQLE